MPVLPLAVNLEYVTLPDGQQAMNCVLLTVLINYSSNITRIFIRLSSRDIILGGFFSYVTQLLSCSFELFDVGSS